MWSTIEGLATVPSRGGPGIAALTGTRWVLAPTDRDALARTDGQDAAILQAALSQLGVWNRPSGGDQGTITSYWAVAARAGGVYLPPPDDPLFASFGGPFLAWAVAQGEAAPPAASSAYSSWRAWGREVQPSAARPGNIAIVEIGQGTRSGLLVGILVRQRPGCVEMVTANIADRVVVTCAPGNIAGFRAPI